MKKLEKKIDFSKIRNKDISRKIYIYYNIFKDNSIKLKKE